MPTNQELYAEIKELKQKVKDLEADATLFNLTPQEVLNLVYYLNKGQYVKIKRELLPALLEKCGLVININKGVVKIVYPKKEVMEALELDEPVEDEEQFKDTKGEEDEWLGTK